MLIRKEVRNRPTALLATAFALGVAMYLPAAVSQECPAFGSCGNDCFITNQYCLGQASCGGCGEAYATCLCLGCGGSYTIDTGCCLCA